jgi:LPXTG-motif cell wall-anchored protein
MKKYIVAVSLVAYILSAHSAMASGIQVSPARLAFEVSGKPQSKELVVVNPTADVQVFRVYADNFTDAFIVSPESFTLEAGQRKNVLVTVNPKRMSANSSMTTTISVIGSPLVSGQLPVGTGAKVAVTVTSTGRSFITENGLIAGAAAVLMAGIGVYWFRRRRKKIHVS